MNHPLHILVVNHSPEILALKEDILEDEGFRVSTRIRNETALPEIAAFNPDLLILDYRAEPELSLLYQLSTDPRTERLPILLCTGALREVSAIRPELDLMGIRVLFKPFDIDDLVSLVRETLDLASDWPPSSFPPD